VEFYPLWEWSGKEIVKEHDGYPSEKKTSRPVEGALSGPDFRSQNTEFQEKGPGGDFIVTGRPFV
jgi:hypothetical protein